MIIVENNSMHVKYKITENHNLKHERPIPLFFDSQLLCYKSFGVDQFSPLNLSAFFVARYLRQANEASVYQKKLAFGSNTYTTRTNIGQALQLSNSCINRLLN